MMNLLAGSFRFLIAGVTSVVAFVLSLPVVLIGAPFWLVSTLTGAVHGGMRRWQTDEVPWDDLIEFVPGIGWKNRGDVKAYVRGNRPFHVTTDPEGWRGKASLDDSDIVVFGDSFAFGHGVDDGAFFANRPSAVRVKAIGANAYNMVQTLLWMERLKDRLAGKLVVWLVFYGNDLMDNLHPHFDRYRTPFVRSREDGEGWEIVTEHVSAEPWPFDPRSWYSNEIGEVCSPTFAAERAFSACDYLIDRARHACESARARLAVVGVPEVELLDSRTQRRYRRRAPDPELFDPRLPDRRLRAICERASVPFVTLSDVLEVDDHLLNDCHWTPRGHQRVAVVLERLYRTAPALSRRAERPQGPVAEPAGAASATSEPGA